MDQNKVIIVGLGFVGQANAIALVRSGNEVWGMDVREVSNLYATEDFDKIHFFKNAEQLPFKPEEQVPVIVCVNAQNGEAGQLLAPSQGALSAARKLTQGLVIYRTTALPRHLAGLDFDLYMPEFLHERMALEEVQFPDMLVLGYKNEAAKQKPTPKFIEDWHSYIKNNPNGKFYEGKPEEAAYIKYLINIWNAFRIGFVNEYGDAIIKDKLTVNHEKIIDFVMNRAFYLRYGKAFGGHCLPKDSEAFLADHKYMKILQGLTDSNKDHGKFEQDENNARELFYGEE